MKIGDNVIAKKDHETPITSGDGIVGTFTIKKGDKFIISEINNTTKCFKIEYNNDGLWFSYVKKSDYFLDYYEKFFYNIEKINRLNKINKILSK